MSKNPFTHHSSLITHHLLMLYRTHVRDALEKQRESFAAFEGGLRDEVGAMAERLRSLAGRTAAEVRAEAGVTAARVSYPSDELERAGGVVVPFGESWRSHEEARRWALRGLVGSGTVSAEGSPVFPGR